MLVSSRWWNMLLKHVSRPFVAFYDGFCDANHNNNRFFPSMFLHVILWSASKIQAQLLAWFLTIFTTQTSVLGLSWGYSISSNCEFSAHNVTMNGSTGHISYAPGKAPDKESNVVFQHVQTKHVMAAIWEAFHFGLVRVVVAAGPPAEALRSLLRSHRASIRRAHGDGQGSWKLRKVEVEPWIFGGSFWVWIFLFLIFGAEFLDPRFWGRVLLPKIILFKQLAPKGGRERGLVHLWGLGAALLASKHGLHAGDGPRELALLWHGAVAKIWNKTWESTESTYISRPKKNMWGEILPFRVVAKLSSFWCSLWLGGWKWVVQIFRHVTVRQNNHITSNQQLKGRHPNSEPDDPDKTFSYLEQAHIIDEQKWYKQR